jgi:hypothetical protein
LDSRISFTTRLDVEENSSPQNSINDNFPDERSEHIKHFTQNDALSQESKEIQSPLANTQKDSQIEAIGVIEQPTVCDLTGSQGNESLHLSDTSSPVLKIKYNQKKRGKSIFDEVLSSEEDCTPINNKLKRNNPSMYQDLIDTPEQKSKSLNRSATAPHNVNLSFNDLTDTPSSSPLKQRKSKMNNLVKDKRRKRMPMNCHFLDLEAEGGNDNGEIESDEDDKGLSQDSFINDSSQLGYSQDMSFTQDQVVISHRQKDASIDESDLFSTPVLKRRRQEQTQSSLPSSEKNIGKMHFIRSVLEHHKRGGDSLGIEREYNSILKAPNDSQESLDNNSSAAGTQSQSIVQEKPPMYPSQERSLIHQNKASKLTAEQRARIEKNRKKALLIRQARLKEQNDAKPK